VLCMRYILEELTEGQILAIDKQSQILNCGISAFDFVAGERSICWPRLAVWNIGASMEAEGLEPTAEPRMMTGTR
jgi:probable phosphoglycerate mutase